MSASQKAAICHVTVLNPARHPRIFYKLACSQRELGHPVTVIGQDSATAPYDFQGIRIIPIMPFGRASLRRWLAPWWMLAACLRVRAQVYTIHAPDLLPTALILKLFGAKIIYDVHEDYARSLTFGDHHPRWHGWLANLWRTWECWAARRFDRIVYAEACYQGMLHVKPEKVFVLENKFTDRAAGGYFAVLEEPYLLYTGTLAAEWGVLDTLDFWEERMKQESIRLVLAGFAADEAFLTQLRNRIATSPHAALITLVGGEVLVPYGQIVALIRGCVAGTAFYQLTPAIEGKHPTKFFEYQAMGKPLFFTPLEDWLAYDAELALGIPWQEGQDVAAAWSKIPDWHQRALHLNRKVCHWENEGVEDMMAGL